MGCPLGGPVTAHRQMGSKPADRPRAPCACPPVVLSPCAVSGFHSCSTRHVIMNTSILQMGKLSLSVAESCAQGRPGRAERDSNPGIRCQSPFLTPRPCSPRRSRRCCFHDTHTLRMLRGLGEGCAVGTDTCAHSGGSGRHPGFTPLCPPPGPLSRPRCACSPNRLGQKSMRSWCCLQAAEAALAPSLPPVSSSIVASDFPALFWIGWNLPDPMTLSESLARPAPCHGEVGGRGQRPPHVVLTHTRPHCLSVVAWTTHGRAVTCRFWGAATAQATWPRVVWP